MNFVDIDGVLRDMDVAVLGGSNEQWDRHVNGVPYVEYVTKHREVLLDSPKMKYCDTIINTLHNNKIPFRLLSCQPESWRSYTTLWLLKHNIYTKAWSTIYVFKTPDKLNYLENGDVLFDDNPLFNDYSKIILVDAPYNRKVTGEKIRMTTENMQEIMDKVCKTGGYE